jgi:glutathione synthase/RimK-type ligase-like ATP-grasp enzyme
MTLEVNKINVANPVKFMQWTLDKHYLKQLEDQSVSVIPTVYYKRGSSLDLSSEFDKNGQYVVKPCVSAGGVGLFHIQSIEDALHYQTEFNQQINDGAYMLQDFIPEIRTHGEWSFVFLGGAYSHAVHKIPGDKSILVQPGNGGSISFSDVPNEQLIQFAKNTYANILTTFEQATSTRILPPLLYLRIDIIERESGPVLVECEGAEPELFFRAHPASVIKFCQTVESFFQTKNDINPQPLLRDIFPRPTISKGENSNNHLEEKNARVFF